MCSGYGICQAVSNGREQHAVPTCVLPLGPMMSPKKLVLGYSSCGMGILRDLRSRRRSGGGLKVGFFLRISATTFCMECMRAQITDGKPWARARTQRPMCF